MSQEIMLPRSRSSVTPVLPVPRRHADAVPHFQSEALPSGAESGRRVFLHASAAAFQSPGGGETQVIKTVEYLRRRGLRAKLFHPVRDRLAEADCLHLFGTLPEHLPLVEAARRAGTPTALSTISWYDLAGYWHLAQGIRSRLACSARFLFRAACPRFPNWRRRLYDAVDLLLPNSVAEAQQLVRFFGVSPEKICVVPNGADPQFADAQPDAFIERYGLKDFLLYCGRIEPRKNQLTFLRAVEGLEVPVVLLGDPVPGYEDYAHACRQAAGDRVHFLGRLPHGSGLLASAYAAARCLVLVSWFETPGLAALEAALSGTPLVLTSRGATREYFGPHAYYAPPNRPLAIRAVVEAALGDARSEDRRRWIRERYTWDEVALATAKAYETVL